MDHRQLKRLLPKRQDNTHPHAVRNLISPTSGLWEHRAQQRKHVPPYGPLKLEWGKGVNRLWRTSQKAIDSHLPNKIGVEQRFT